MAGNKNLPKEVSNWLFTLELDRRQKMYHSVLEIARFLPKTWTGISEENLSNKISQLTTRPLFQFFAVFRSGCVTVYQGNTSLFLQPALWDAMTFALRASQEQWYFWLNKADLWKKVSCCVFPPSFLRHEYCLGWAIEFLEVETALFPSPYYNKQ